jgi:hypothetical protein
VYYVLLIGANQRITRWSQTVGNEQIVPNRQRTKIARRTVWYASLHRVLNIVSVVSPDDLRLKCGHVAIHGMHHCGCKNHLRDRVGQTCNSCRLTKEVAPTDDPGPCCNVFWRYYVFGDIVHTSSSRICANQLSHLPVR